MHSPDPKKDSSGGDSSGKSTDFGYERPDPDTLRPTERPTKNPKESKQD